MLGSQALHSVGICLQSVTGFDVLKNPIDNRSKKCSTDEKRRNKGPNNEARVKCNPACLAPYKMGCKLSAKVAHGRPVKLGVRNAIDKSRRADVHQ